MEYYKRFAATKELGKINADILNEGINFFARHHSPQPQNLPQQSNNAFFFPRGLPYFKKYSIPFSQLIFFFILLFPHSIKGQQIDSVGYEKYSEKMLLLAKINIIPYIFNVDSADVICSFLKEPITYRKLGSKGFSKNIIFFLIHITWDQSSNYLFLYEGDLIFAFNTRSEILYKLKGFNDNDFKDFFDDLYFNNIDYINASELDLKSKKKFLEAFNVEGLDLDCLYESLAKRKESKPCMALIKPLKN